MSILDYLYYEKETYENAKNYLIMLIQKCELNDNTIKNIQENVNVLIIYNVKLQYINDLIRRIKLGEIK